MQLNTVAKHSVMTEMPPFHCCLLFCFLFITVNYRKCPPLNLFCSPLSAPLSLDANSPHCFVSTEISSASNQLGWAGWGQPWDTRIRSSAFTMKISFRCFLVVEGFEHEEKGDFATSPKHFR